MEPKRGRSTDISISKPVPLSETPGDGFVDSVVLLWHVHRDDDKLIGVYRSEDDARAAIERLRDKPGFKDAPDGFAVPYVPAKS
jgi:hypothetical protein